MGGEVYLRIRQPTITDKNAGEQRGRRSTKVENTTTRKGGGGAVSLDSANQLLFSGEIQQQITHYQINNE